MDNLHKQVYAGGQILGHNPDEIEINPEYVYMMIPSDWVCLYHKLLGYLADFGEVALKDCKVVCQGNNLYVIQCWNMFQSAVACRNLGKIKQADVLIDYIKAQLDIIYSNSDKEVYCGGGEVFVTKDGHLKARVSCDTDESYRFFINKEDGHLYEEYDAETQKTVFHIENGDLISETEE